MIPLLLLATGCDSQNVIDGQVVDPWGNPLAGATVMIVGGQERPLTDDNGAYRLAAVPGELKLKAGKKGYIQDQHDLVVEKGRRRVEGPLFELFPKPEANGMYLLGGHGYISIPPQRVRTVGNELRQYRGITDHGAAKSDAKPPRLVYHTDAREDEIRALDLRLRRLTYVADTDLTGPLGVTTVRVSLWTDAGDVKYELKPLNSKTDYLLPLPEDLPPGVYAFETQGLLSGRPEQVDALPPELRVVFPFEIE